MIQSEITKAEAEFKKEAPQIREDIEDELEPFLNGMITVGTRSRSFKLFKEAYQYFDKKFRENSRLFNAIAKTGWHYFKGIEDVTYMFFLYLGMIESLGNSIVDILVMLLVANGRDFHIECRGYRTPKIRHAVSIREDLEKERVPLGIKVNFLRENGLNELASIIDSELRNAIAHQRFSIKENRFYLKMRTQGKRSTKERTALIVTIIGLRKLELAIKTTRQLLNQLAESKKILTGEHSCE